MKSTSEAPPWYQAWTNTSRFGIGTSDGMWLTQFSCVVCATGQLVVALEDELAVDDLVDRVRAPAQLVGRAAARGRAAAPLVGEEDLLAVVGERRAVPVGEQRVGDGVDALRVRRVGDVDQQAVALAGAGGEVELLVDRDVVAAQFGVRRRRPTAMPDGMVRRLRRVLEAVDARRPRWRTGAARSRPPPSAGAASGTLMTSIRHCDGFGLVAGSAVAARELGRRADTAGARDVDVDVGGVGLRTHQRVRMRAAAGLDLTDLDRRLDVRDVEDADAAEARRRRRPPGSACSPSSRASPRPT